MLGAAHTLAYIHWYTIYIHTVIHMSYYIHWRSQHHPSSTSGTAVDDGNPSTAQLLDSSEAAHTKIGAYSVGTVLSSGLC